MSLAETTRARLERHGLWAKKRFGQNFLVDGGVVRDIAEAALRNASPRVVEIGPGLGALTEALLDLGAEVTSVERDPSLIPVLEEALAGRPFQLVSADALEIDFGALGPERPTVAGNIPYNISSPLLHRLIAQRDRIGPVTLMVQREVAERWMAGPGTKAYGSPSVMIQTFADLRRVRGVPPQCFLPAPKVHSTVIRMDWLATPRVEVGDPKHYERVVRAGFGMRRKTLRNALKASFTADQLARAEAVVDLRRRAETLDLPDWSRLAEAMRG